MPPENPPAETFHHIRVDSSGRIRLPVELREKLGVIHGDCIVVVDRGDEVRLETAANALAKAQEYFASFVPEGVSLVNDLMDERHMEVGNE